MGHGVVMSYPPWVVLHVPHDSTEIPETVLGQLLLTSDELAAEISRMTDHHTLAIFRDPASSATVVRAPVSRLVVDVERFEDDVNEPMAARGMGAVYSVTSQLKPLRRALRDDEREELMRAYYRPHHAQLEAAVESALERHGRCCLVDCHSFPTFSLPYELASPGSGRPDICIGTDDFHTSAELAEAFVTEFRRAGWTVNLNDPFAGAIVPASRYRRDRRVAAVMVEVSRGLYLTDGASQLPEFERVAMKIRQCCMNAVNALQRSRGGA